MNSKLKVTPLRISLVFAGVGLVWRLLFLPVSQSSYTDGILQIDMFRQGLSYWPPLFALLARLLAWIPGLGLEGSARLVCIICGVLVFFPLAAIARRLFGQRAANWAMAAWLASPLALQWSLQGMTDMPATLLWLAALAALLIGIEYFLPGLFAQNDPAPLPDPRRGHQWLLLASLAGAMTTLTRYQGALLLPPIVLAVWWVGKIRRGLPGRTANPWLTLLPWLAVPAWAVKGLSSLARHGQQINERAIAGDFTSTLLHVYWFNFEEFLLKSPYFLTYGLFGFMLYGLFRTQWKTVRLRWAGWLCLYFALGILVAQSIFSSWQARYLLPLVPLACLFAGHGLAVWERHNEGRPLRLWSLAAPALGLGLVFSALVAAYQGNPFKEIKDAALAVRAMQLPETTRVYCNEVYNQKIGPAKTTFWAGRRIEAYGFATSPQGEPMLIAEKPPRPDDVVILTSAYCGGLENYRRLRTKLVQSLPAEVVGKKAYARSALPLMTDLMQEPGLAQNPLAWYFRYQSQYYETTVLRVGGQRLDAPFEPIAPLPDDQPLKKMEEIKKEIEKGKAKIGTMDNGQTNQR